MKTPDNILGFHLKESDYFAEREQTLFAEIDKIAEGIGQEQVEILRNLVVTADRQFSYDWLEKNDPDNYILGKLCSCCAHLEGVGNGIMQASIIHPEVQNLVIRDAKGEIVAKSTLYVNTKEGYGVFNNVEVYENLSDRDHDLIYDKYILAIKDFVREYNKLRPDNPIRKINVGMHLNDLENQITEKHEVETKLLKAIDYGPFCEFDLHYEGDSDEDQRIMWEASQGLE